MAFEDSRAFLQSNSLIAKVAFLLLVVMVFVFVLRLGTQFMSWLFQPSGSPILIDGLIDGDQYMVIDQDPKNKNSIPVLRSDDERTGIEFTWSVWLLIKDFERDSEKYKHIFHKGNDSAATESNGLIQPNNAPGVYIHPNRNSLVILLNTFTNINEEIMVNDIPQSKWFNLTIRVQNKVLDVYMNGSIVVRHKLSGVPKQNYSRVYVAKNNGFKGNLSNLRYYDYALGTNEIERVSMGGPNLKRTGPDVVNMKPPYLATRWYINNDTY